jgi:hypothetical protein
MPHLSHSSRFDHPKNIGWGVQIIKFLIMYFSPLPCYLVPLRPKYSTQHPILKHPQPAFVRQCERPSFTLIQKTDKIIVMHILNFRFLGSKLEDKTFCTEWEQTFPDFNTGWIKNQTGPVDTQDLPVSSVPLLPARLTPLLLATHAVGVDITSLLQRSLLSQHFRYGHISCFLTSGLLFSHRIGVLPLKDRKTSVRSLECPLLTVRIWIFLYIYDFNWPTEAMYREYLKTKLSASVRAA